MNWYAYVGNDPLNGTDPTGNDTQDIDQAHRNHRMNPPKGVVSFGIESTLTAGVAGTKAGFGIYIDRNTDTTGVYIKSGTGISGVDDKLAAGAEVQLAVSVDFADNIEDFEGTSVETSVSAGLIGLDAAISTEGRGLTTSGIDVGVGGGESLFIMETVTIPLGEDKK